jgi:hypothetical protein
MSNTICEMYWVFNVSLYHIEKFSDRPFQSRDFRKIHLYCINRNFTLLPPTVFYSGRSDITAYLTGFCVFTCLSCGRTVPCLLHSKAEVKNWRSVPVTAGRQFLFFREQTAYKILRGHTGNE